jgi:hypothetical protein
MHHFSNMNSSTNQPNIKPTNQQYNITNQQLGQQANKQARQPRSFISANTNTAAEIHTDTAALDLCRQSAMELKRFDQNPAELGAALRCPTILPASH